VSASQGGARRLVLVRAANLTVRSDRSMTEPFRTRFEGRPPEVQAGEDAVTLEYPRFAVRRRRPYRSTITLNGSVPWRIEARGPLSSFTGDLAGITLEAFDVHQGAARVQVLLPRPSGVVPIQASGGVAQATFRRPAGVEARVHVRGGAAGLALDDQTFRAVGGGVNWQTPGWDDATDRYDFRFLKGVRGLTVDVADVPSAPGGRTGRALATVLFTDIVGSTERAHREGDRRWGEVLDRHDAVARQLVELEGGRLVKTTGDGILAAFDEPGRAIGCARALRGELRSIGVDIRTGLHTGEVEYRGSDLGGIAVHIASRIMDAAGPGEILVSRTVRDLVAGSDVGLAQRGTHALKGVGDDWELFAVT
jgi:class 3 adenylate cyclase